MPEPIPVLARRRTDGQPPTTGCRPLNAAEAVRARAVVVLDLDTAAAGEAG